MRQLLSTLLCVFGAGLYSAGSVQARDQAPSPSAPTVIVPDEEVRWQSMTPSLGWKWTSAFQSFSGSVSVYFTYTREGAPEGRPSRLQLVARQVVRVREKADQVSWTESDSCPALLEVTSQFQEMTPPRTVILGWTWPPEHPQMVLDGVNWTLWSNTAQQHGRYPASYQFGSNSGPIAEWGGSARVALEGCWVDDPPPENF